MKRMFLLLIAANGVLSAEAQTRDDAASHRRPFNADSLLSHWAIDVNLMGGMLRQDLFTVNPAPNYPNAVSVKSGKLTFTDGMSYGGSAQIGWFFDTKGHFGIGTGLTYFYQRGNMNLDAYRVDYKSWDANGNVYRQITTANAPIKEELQFSNLNIPLVAKYKVRFTRKVGFTADADVLFNLMNEARYKTNASFDYEAIYKHVTGSDGNVYTVYDGSPTHATSDLAITRAQYTKTNPGGNVNEYFAYQSTLGYNVGLAQTPYKNTGKVSYSSGSVGIILQPSFVYYFNDKVSLNIGAYYSYQALKYNAQTGSRITDRVGDYTSVLTNVERTEAHSFGGNLGLRFLFGKLRDSDGDGIPNRKDKCPHIAGVAKFNGCPDRDNDGIPDSQDECVDIPGVAKFHGCPDTDGDGIPDAEDSCATVAGPRSMNGCPDTDGDGITDAKDKCPTVAGPASNNGCPPEPPKPPVYEKPEHDMTEPIFFDLGKSTIKEESLPILMEAVMEMVNNENAFVVIDGHTDNTGSMEKNDALSFQRATAVKTYLAKMGADPKRLVAIGHGPRQPIAPNDTKENRSKNRRVIMSLKHRPKKAE